MGPLGWQETVFILVLALLIFGPKKLPELGKTIGKAMTEFRRASTELKSTFDREMRSIEKETESLKTEVNKNFYDGSYDYGTSDYDPYYNSGSSDSDTAASASDNSSTVGASEDSSADLPKSATEQAADSTPAGSAPENTVARTQTPAPPATSEPPAVNG
jgi:TatA/E family protein of Tat protein translocase